MSGPDVCNHGNDGSKPCAECGADAVSRREPALEVGPEIRAAFDALDVARRELGAAVGRFVGRAAALPRTPSEPSAMLNVDTLEHAQLLKIARAVEQSGGRMMQWPSVLVGALLEIAHEQRVDGLRSPDSPPPSDELVDRAVRWEWCQNRGHGWPDDGYENKQAGAVLRDIRKRFLSLFVALRDFGERPTPEPGDTPK